VASDSIALVGHLFRRQTGQMVARLTRTLGSRHLAMAEDAVQAAASYRSALTLARPAPEQRWLTTRLTHLV